MAMLILIAFQSLGILAVIVAVQVFYTDQLAHPVVTVSGRIGQYPLKQGVSFRQNARPMDKEPVDGLYPVDIHGEGVGYVLQLIGAVFIILIEKQ
jgi:hypothetical protein